MEQEQAGLEFRVRRELGESPKEAAFRLFDGLADSRGMVQRYGREQVFQALLADCTTPSGEIFTAQAFPDYWRAWRTEWKAGLRPVGQGGN